MARKKQEEVQKFYAKFWPQNGMVSGISNELPDSGSFIEIEKNIAERFLSGEDSYNKYKVVDNKLQKDLPEVNLTPVVAVFEAITDIASDQNFVVEWNKPNKHWKFISTVNDPAVFYIVDANNYSKLIRTIHLENIDKQSIYKFEDNQEEDISSLAVITRKYLKSYGIKKVYE